MLFASLTAFFLKLLAFILVWSLVLNSSKAYPSLSAPPFTALFPRYSLLLYVIILSIPLFKSPSRKWVNPWVKTTSSASMVIAVLALIVPCANAFSPASWPLAFAFGKYEYMPSPWPLNPAALSAMYNDEQTGVIFSALLSGLILSIQLSNN